MYEIKANIHIHTSYSDGSKYHAKIAQDAVKSGIDVIFFTDHNIYIDGVERYFNNTDGKILIVMGEEIHDQNATPQKNHLLSLGAGKSFTQLSNNRQALITKINSAGGVSFIAHPYDPAMPAFNEPDISWNDWSVNNFTGIELWNGFSELKVRARKKAAAYFYAFFPRFLPLSPPPKTIRIWDSLLNKGQKVVAIGGSDAHALHFSAGPIKRVVFPYIYHFSTINNHILLKNKLTGIPQKDTKTVLNGLRNGNLFIANDLIHSARGFKFIVTNNSSQIEMGESCKITEDMNLKVLLPKRANCRILKNGNLLHQSKGKKEINLKIDSPGIYRVECYKYYLGRKRAWIFSNPIFIE